VEGFLFSPDGRYLGAAYSAGRGKVWDLGRPGESLTLTGEVCRFSPDGRKVLTWVSRADGAMRLYDLPSGKEQKRFKVGPGWHDFAWHPDGRQLAVSQGNGVQLWDLNTGQVQRMLSPAGVLAWHPGGRFLAMSVASDGEQHIKVHDVVANRLQSDIRVPTPRITRVGFSHSGDLLFSNGWDDTIRVWNPLTGRQHVALEGVAVSGWGMMGFSRDDRLLVCTQTGTQVTLWEVARPDVESDVVVPTASGPVGWANFSPDDRLLLVGTVHRLCLWDRDAGRAVAFLPAGGQAQFHPNGDSILSAGGSGLLRWPIAEEPAGPGQARGLRIGPPELLANPREYRWLSLTRDGRTLAAVDHTRQCAVILDLEDKTSKVTTGTQHNMHWCALNPDGRWLVTGAWWTEGKGAIKVWDARTGQLEPDLPRDLASGDSSPLFSPDPDSRWLVTLTNQREFRFWKAGTWDSSRTVKRQGGPVDQAMAFTPDGSLLAIARTRTLVQLIDPDTGAELADLEMPDADSITSLAFNRDGTLLAAGRENQVVHVWDLRRLRGRWAKFGLDWDRPPYPPALDSGTDTPRPSTPLRVIVDVGDRLRKAEANRLVSQAAGHASAKEYVKAVDLLRQVIRTDPKHAQAHNDLAWLRLTGPRDLRDPKEGLLLARKAIGLAPKQSFYQNTLGVALYRNDRFAEAVGVLEKSLEKGGRKHDACDLFFLAMCHHRLGDDDKAKGCLDRAERWFEERRSRLLPREVEELIGFEAEARVVLQTP
jgi:WD40 repeat protein/Tfp pilus assembly protein PilF